MINNVRSNEWKSEDVLRAALAQQDHMSHLRAFLPSTVSRDSFYQERIAKLNETAEKGLVFVFLSP